MNSNPWVGVSIVLVLSGAYGVLNALKGPETDQLIVKLGVDAALKLGHFVLAEIQNQAGPGRYRNSQPTVAKPSPNTPFC